MINHKERGTTDCAEYADGEQSRDGSATHGRRICRLVSEEDWAWAEKFLTRGDVLEAIGWDWDGDVARGWLNQLRGESKHWAVRAHDWDGCEGFVVFLDRGKGEFEGHACCAVKTRGWAWVRLSRAVLGWFCGSHPEVKRVWTTCRRSHQMGHVYVRRMGFRQRQIFRNGSGVEMVRYELERVQL